MAAKHQLTFLCLSLSVFLFMIASQVAAAASPELADTAPSRPDSAKDAAEDKNNKNEVGDGGHLPDTYGGRVCPWGCCHRRIHGGGCLRCCHYKGEAMDANAQPNSHG